MAVWQYEVSVGERLRTKEKGGRLGGEVGRAVFTTWLALGACGWGCFRGGRPVVRWLLSGLDVLGGWSLGVCLGEGGRGGAC